MSKITTDLTYTKEEFSAAIKMLDTASELAERNGCPAMARDLAVAIITLQRFNVVCGENVCYSPTVRRC